MCCGFRCLGMWISYWHKCCGPQHLGLYEIHMPKYRNCGFRSSGRWISYSYSGFRGFRFLAKVTFEWISWISIIRHGFRFLGSGFRTFCGFRRFRGFRGFRFLGRPSIRLPCSVCGPAFELNLKLQASLSSASLVN